MFANEQHPFNSYGSRMDLSYKKKTRPLKLKKKLYEFYAAPITKYFCHSVRYGVLFPFEEYRQKQNTANIGEAGSRLEVNH